MKDYNNIGVGLVVSNGCTLSHLAVLESGATPTQRKAGWVGCVYGVAPTTLHLDSTCVLN